eukprot:c91_g1_i1.p1 GENE.c91_g1_i1~~c91_g1_i1.p1  ORF type:complete len:365 (-),score=62.65 c91_g1_i1:248-1342(-)
MRAWGLSALALACILLPQSPWQYNVIKYIQSHSFLDPILEAITHVGHPVSCFMLAPSLIWVLDGTLGLQVMASVIWADSLNALLKLPLRGDRPYWMDDQLRQFSMTCESGYGMPSGHVMVSAAVWCLIAAYTRSWHVKLVVGLYLVSIAISRLHVAAHFPTQVLAGLFCGLLTCDVFLTHWWRLHRFMLVRSKADRARGLILLTTCVVVFFVLNHYAIEFFLSTSPLHSISLAKRGCRIPGGVHVNTAPVTGLIRNVGVLVGAGSVIVFFPTVRMRLARDWMEAHGKLWCVLVSVWRLVFGHLVLGIVFVVLEAAQPQEIGLMFGVHAVTSYACYSVMIVLGVPLLLIYLEENFGRNRPEQKRE